MPTQKMTCRRASAIFRDFKRAMLCASAHFERKLHSVLQIVRKIPTPLKTSDVGFRLFT